ncbi:MULTISPECIES: zinc metalloprotease [Flavobacteriaceae]|uniref:Zinc metalloprotease n=2 Tax=Flavobacteriaceae TaxID=49546 RepID=A0A4Y8ASW5_9FLAO|nr:MULTISPECIES: zinc metalloprotease [Flavobacteriaceae]TEW73746.1 zinc metalloprotease [Gramella jeungdoensis]GGK37191.1 zinc metalloprotease [Lutibacter litoralis]
MKKFILFFAIVAFAFVACQENSDEATPTQETLTVDMSDFYVYTDDDLSGKSTNGSNKDKCHTMKVLNQQLKENPGLYKKMYNIEKHTRTFIAAKGKPTNPGGGNGGDGTDPGTDPVDDGLGVINIPVYFHVVYSNAEENVSDAQITAQMSVLNEDFRKANNDINKVPAEFSGIAADSEITFTNAGTFRHSNSTGEWGTRDAVKSAYPPITPSTHLNIWVCNIGGGILGYAQFPGGSSSTDGVVLLYSSLPGGSAAPYNEGRTATHEVGHYLNLRHIWGDGRCRQDDFVADTPSSDGPNYGCPSFPTVNCKSTDMTMNYMDYTNDDCMYMFSEGQKSRMRAIFASGGARESLNQ